MDPGRLNLLSSQNKSKGSYDKNQKSQQRKEGEARKGRPTNTQPDENLHKKLETQNFLHKFIVENYQDHQETNIYQVSQNLQKLIQEKINPYIPLYEELQLNRETFKTVMLRIIDQFLQYENNYLDPKYDPMIIEANKEEDEQQQYKRYPILSSGYFFNQYIIENQQKYPQRNDFLFIEQFMAIQNMELILKVTNENFLLFFKILDLSIQKSLCLKPEELLESDLIPVQVEQIQAELSNIVEQHTSKGDKQMFSTFINKFSNFMKENKNYHDRPFEILM